MAARGFSLVAAGAAGLLLSGTMAMSSAAARQPWPGNPDTREPARPHYNCEGLSHQQMLDCERRMRERMRNSSDDPRTLQGSEEATDSRRVPTPQEQSKTMQAENPPVQSPDSKRIGRAESRDDARTPSTEDRTRSSRSQQDRSATEPTSDSSDTLGRKTPRPPDNADTHRPQSTTSTDTTTESRDSNQDADTLGRDRSPDNSATDTSSPK